MSAYGLGFALLGGASAATACTIASLQALPKWMVQAHLSAAAVAVLLVDWSNAAYPGAVRVWGLQVLVIDCCLVFDVPQRQAQAIVAATVAWLMIVATEASLRWGLFDIDFIDDADRTLQAAKNLCDCPNPPCASGIWPGIRQVLVYGAVFITDYFLTRDFASGMRYQMAMVESSILAVADITSALALFDLTDAARALGTNTGLLPNELHR
eukprot:gene2223-17194_t